MVKSAAVAKYFFTLQDLERNSITRKASGFLTTKYLERIVRSFNKLRFFQTTILSAGRVLSLCSTVGSRRYSTPCIMKNVSNSSIMRFETDWTSNLSITVVCPGLRHFPYMQPSPSIIPAIQAIWHILKTSIYYEYIHSFGLKVKHILESPESLNYYNVAGNGRRESEKNIEDWATSSRATMKMAEGSTVIPEGSRGKRPEALSIQNMDDDMTYSLVKAKAAR